MNSNIKYQIKDRICYSSQGSDSYPDFPPTTEFLKVSH